MCAAANAAEHTRHLMVMVRLVPQPQHQLQYDAPVVQNVVPSSAD